jgi:chromate transporter
LVGVAFVAPSFLMVLLLSAVYVRAGGASWMEGAFYGIGAAVIAIIARSAVKLARTTLGGDPMLWMVFGINAIVTAWTEREMVSLLLIGGLVTLVRHTRSSAPRASASVALAAMPPWLLTGLQSAATTSALGQIAWVFAKAGAVVFGSGLAIVPYLYGVTVDQQRWLTERQFLDAVAVSMITPGPVVITVAFIGYLVAGPLGGTAAALGVFFPVWLSVVVMAPWFQRVVRDARARAFVGGITAGAAGAIAGAAVVLGRRAIVDVPTAVIAGLTMLVLVRWRRVPEPIVIAAAALVGVALRAR